MSDHYVMDPGPAWAVDTSYQTLFNWGYDDRRARLIKLYEKGKKKQWNGNERLDWSIQVDPQSAENVPDFYVPIYGSPWWNKMNDKERGEVRQHTLAWTNSQFLHGEQGALICAAKIIQSVPDMDAKFYAATQVMDEARHAEVYDRYLREKVEMAYPINRELQNLLEQVVNDSRWDFTYLGMQIMIEGLALAAFGLNRDFSNEPLFAALNAYVMQDEARHVAFGVQALSDIYPQMTQKERDEREEFVVEACYLMRDRLLAPEVWEYLGLPDGVTEWVANAPTTREFRKLLFGRIVPTIKQIGLWGPRVQRAFEDMGVLGFQNMDVDEAFAFDDGTATLIDEYRAKGYSLDEAIKATRADDISKTIAAADM